MALCCKFRQTVDPDDDFSVVLSNFGEHGKSNKDPVRSQPLTNRNGSGPEGNSIDNQQNVFYNEGFTGWTGEEKQGQFEKVHQQMSEKVHFQKKSEKKEFVTNFNQNNGVIQPLLTDLYQITMAYSYWKAGKNNEMAVFDLFFRKNPFKGEFCLFAGLEECLKFLKNFKYSGSDIEYIKTLLPDTAETAFFEYLMNMTTDEVTIYAIDEGTVVFPKVPLLRIEGPLAVVQLLETTLLTLVNFASLVATNAARFRMAAGVDKRLLEFGLRRAQGPDGGLSASRYCYMGGFDGTSNVLAGKTYGIPVRGTHAHAFVTSYTSLYEIRRRELIAENGKTVDLVKLTLDWMNKLSPTVGVGKDDTNSGELAAFISYALAFPEGLIALVDTYDVLRSGIPNFCAVAMALADVGYRAQGIRLDSGDLAYLSLEARKIFCKVAKVHKRYWFEDMMIVASDGINEAFLHSLNEKGDPKNGKPGHALDSFGIGTNLVTCQAQPALGCVFKLVEINGVPRIKLSEEVAKVTIPGKKMAYRLYGSDGTAIADLLQQPDEDPPQAGQRVLCRNPFQESKRVNIVPARVEQLYKVFYKDGKIQEDLPVLKHVREHAIESLATIRADQKRALNPTPYKVSVTDKLYKFIHSIWLENAPISELT